jgi:hypothetical protein
MNADALLDEAQRLLDETPSGTASAWPRAAAILARQALEAAMTDLWHRREPSLAGTPFKPQLLCLPGYVPAPVAADVGFVWHALTRATHHRPYECDPTREELASLLRSVRSVVRAVSGT